MAWVSSNIMLLNLIGLLAYYMCLMYSVVKSTLKLKAQSSKPQALNALLGPKKAHLIKRALGTLFYFLFYKYTRINSQLQKLHKSSKSTIENKERFPHG